MITDDEIRAIVTRDPFVPVRLYMNDGRTFDITRPWIPGDNMLIRKEWLSLGVYRKPTSQHIHHVEYVYLPWVERVEEIAAPAAPAMNG